MTIASTETRKEYAGNGATTLFPYPYKFFADADLVVILVNDATGAGVTQVLTTNYSVAGAGLEAGGSVTMVTPPASGETLVIYFDAAVLQSTDYVANDPFPAETHEKALDKLTRLIQRTRDIVDRSIKLADDDISGASTTIPNPVALNLIRWKADITGMENVLLTPADSIVQADFVERVNNMLGLINIASPDVDKTYRLLGFFFLAPQVASKGGGDFVWQLGVNKNLADGGSVIDPDTLGGFDGTQSTLAAFLAAQGTGTGLGCWVRQYTDIYPEDFGAAGDDVVDDSNTIQVTIQHFKVVNFLDTSTYFLGTTGIGFDKTGVVLNGGKATLRYTGTDQALWVNGEYGNTDACEFAVNGFVIKAPNAAGIRVGRTVTSPKAAVGSINHTQATGCDIGMVFEVGQIVNVDNADVVLNRIGLHIADFDGTASLVNTDLNFTNCRFRANTEQGVLIDRVWQAKFYWCQMEGNGLEGAKINKTDSPLHQIIIEGGWIENNNTTISNDAYQVLATNQNQGGGVLDFLTITGVNFAVSNLNNYDIGLFGDISPISIYDNRYDNGLGGETAIHGVVGCANIQDISIHGNESYSNWIFSQGRSYTSGGTTEIMPGDTVTGSVSGSTATVTNVGVSSGTWAGGDAAGFIYITDASGAFQAENLLVSAVDLATIAAAFANYPGTFGKNIITNRQSAEIDFDGVAASIILFVPNRSGVILNMYTVYTETSGTGLGATTYEVGTLVTSDKYNTGTFASLVPAGTVSHKTLSARDFAAGDSIVFSSTNGVTTAGKIMVVIEYIYD